MHCRYPVYVVVKTTFAVINYFTANSSTCLLVLSSEKKIENKITMPQMNLRFSWDTFNLFRVKLVIFHHHNWKSLFILKCNFSPHFIIAQMVVPKRAAMLLDRIMVALHHALEDGDKEGVQRISDLYAGSRNASKNAHLNKEQAQHYMGNKCTKLTKFHFTSTCVPELILWNCFSMWSFI